MVTVISIEPPFEQKARNIVTLKKIFHMSAPQAQILYERIFSQELPQDFADEFVAKLKLAGWTITTAEDTIYEKERVMIEAKQWYEKLSQREKEFVAYFQRMMIPSSF